MTTELAIRPDQTSFDAKQRAALASIGVQNASDADVALFFHQAARTGLDPFARQIYLINRGGKQTIQVGIDGFRLIRDRAGTYQGHTEEWCGMDGQWRDVWLDTKPPAAARVSVYVRNYVHPVVGIALWSEYAQMGRDGKPQALWGSKPALMLAKCAEALALRKAYPQDLSGLYVAEEMPSAEQDEDGVYVTTMMRSNPNQNPTTVKASGRANETEVQSRPDQHDTPARATRPGPPPAASQPTGGRAESRDKAAVAQEWLDRVLGINDLTKLYEAHEEAAKLNVLDHALNGRTHHGTVEEAFLNRRQQLQQEQAEAMTELPF